MPNNREQCSQPGFDNVSIVCNGELLGTLPAIATPNGRLATMLSNATALEYVADLLADSIAHGDSGLLVGVDGRPFAFQWPIA